MNRNDIMMLHNAGALRHVHVTDATIRYVYFLEKGLIKISNIADHGEEINKPLYKAWDDFRRAYPARR